MAVTHFSYSTSTFFLSRNMTDNRHKAAEVLAAWCIETGGMCCTAHSILLPTSQFRACHRVHLCLEGTISASTVNSVVLASVYTHCPDSIALAHATDPPPPPPPPPTYAHAHAHAQYNTHAHRCDCHRATFADRQVLHCPPPTQKCSNSTTTIILLYRIQYPAPVGCNSRWWDPGSGGSSRESSTKGSSSRASRGDSSSAVGWCKQ
jgi:hypothetical protein